MDKIISLKLPIYKLLNVVNMLGNYREKIGKERVGVQTLKNVDSLIGEIKTQMEQEAFVEGIKFIKPITENNKKFQIVFNDEKSLIVVGDEIDVDSELDYVTVKVEGKIVFYAPLTNVNYFLRVWWWN